MSLKDDFYNINKEFGRGVEEHLQTNPSFSDNSYVTGFQRFFSNKALLHINYTNFKLINDYFYKQKNKKMNILDLGCGLGDKTFIFKRVFKKSNVYGVETTKFDDPNQKKDPPSVVFKHFYPFFKKKFDINLSLYDGIKLKFPDKHFDIIFLFAVIEHIAPEKRQKFIKEISKKLKDDGYIVITKCPRKYSLTEFVARSLKLAHHPWLLSKNDLLGVFDDKEFEKVYMKSISNIPSNPESIVQKFAFILIPIDYLLQFLHWPFASDYFLIEKKVAKK
jgi:SAM-dependent methyltransferase